MSKSKYNKKGELLFHVGKRAVFTVENKIDKVTKVTPDDESLEYGDYEIAPWFDTGNTHPSDIERDYIKKTTVLKASIGYKRRLIVGQGIFVARIVGYNANGEEILEPVLDKEIVTFCNSRMVNSYLDKAAGNFATWENLFPELIMNDPRTKIIGIHENKATITRWGIKNSKDEITNAYIHSDWDEVDSIKIKQIKVLNYDDPLEDLKDRAKNLSKVMFLNSMYDSDYYLTPDYETAIESKWVHLAQKTPIYLNAAYDNALNILFHIKIPSQYIDEKFPMDEFKSFSERNEAVDNFLDELEKELTTVENARKTITNISIDGHDGKPLYWEIEVIDHKQNIDKDILASDAADSQITNTFLINDAVFLKKGGMGQGAGSGSDIREAHLINVSLVKTDRDRIIEPLGLIRDFNGPPWSPDMVFRFRDTVLNTLNTGSNTSVIVS